MQLTMMVCGLKAEGVFDLPVLTLDVRDKHA